LHALILMQILGIEGRRPNSEVQLQTEFGLRPSIRT
jgi:hypothetical protein